MYFTPILATLAGLASVATAVPAHAVEDVAPVARGLKGRTRFQKRAAVVQVIQQTIVEQNTVVVVEQNLDTIAELALIAEQQFATIVQQQLLLLQTVETIKNNIRVNHFKSRFNTVNTVIVTVTELVDARDEANINSRYLVNQLLADNGKPDNQIVVMLNADAAMTINAVPTPTLAVSGVLNAAESTPTGTPVVQGFDVFNPFGLSNQSVILPYNSSRPTLPNAAQLFKDPASIILPGQAGLFVEDLSLFTTDCALWGANQQSLFNLQTLLVAGAQEVAAQQLLGLVLGQNFNADLAAVVLQKAALAQQLQNQQNQQQNQQEQNATATQTADAAKETKKGGNKKGDDMMKLK